MTVAYVVTAGDYSDYHICGVFSTEEKAQAFIDAYGGSDSWCTPSIEEWQIDECMGPIERGLVPYMVFFEAKTGHIQDMKRTSPESNKEERPSCHYLSNTYHGHAMHRVDCWAKDADHAVKLACDVRREFIANGG